MQVHALQGTEFAGIDPLSLAQVQLGRWFTMWLILVVTIRFSFWLNVLVGQTLFMTAFLTASDPLSLPFSLGLAGFTVSPIGIV